MVWGCISAKGVKFLEKVTGRLNGDAYTDLLGDSLIPSVHLHSRLDLSTRQHNVTHGSSSEGVV